MDKVLIFVDDGFFKLVKKHFQKKLNKKLKFMKTFRNICEKEKLFLERLFIYMAPPYQSEMPTGKEDKLKQNYDNMRKMLSKKDWVTIREGRCRRLKINNKFEYCQKGVDTLLVMDLIKTPIVFPDVKKIILIASDSDFIPAIKDLKSQGIEIILYTYFDKRRHSKFSTSNQLLKVVSKWVKLKSEDFD